jgi:mxaL protein
MTMKNHWLKYWLKYRDTNLLAFALICLLGAVLRPSIPIERNVHTYFLIADITQSMNAKDMLLNGQEVSRLDYTKHMMHDIVSQLPCHTRLSIGLFAGDAVAALYTPLQVCEHFSAIHETIDHLDWRMAWTGNSQLRESLMITAKLLRQMPEATKAVYFTDGDEAPLLHAFNTRNLSDFQGGDGWFFVGIGTDKGTGIPKMTENNQVIGYWSNESYAVQPNIAQVTASKSSGRDDSVAFSEHDRFISKRDSSYLQKLAQEIGATHINGDNTYEVLQTLQSHHSPRYETVSFSIVWILASMDGISILSMYIHRVSVRHLKQTLNLYRKHVNTRLFPSGDSIAHDNHLE